MATSHERSQPISTVWDMPSTWAAIGAVLIGLPYALRLFGDVEAEVTHWGWVSMGLGGLLAALAWVARVHDGAGRVADRPRLTAIVAATTAATLAAIALMQALPALLWVLFHGHEITDGSPPGGFVGHWALALPHVAVAAIALVALRGLLRARRGTDASRFEEVLEAHRFGEPLD